MTLRPPASRRRRFVVAGVMAIAGIVATSVLLLMFLAHTPWLANRVSRIVHDETQRTLTLDGGLSWTFSMTPAVEIRLGHATLSERNDARPFAAIDGARVTLRLRPLLSRQIVIDSIELSGPKVTVVRHADGTLNVDDLLAPRKHDAQPLQFSIASTRIAGGAFVWLDEAASRRIALEDLRLDIGRLGRASSGPLEFSAQLRAPSVDEAAIRLKARYDVDFDAGVTHSRFVLDDFGIALSAKVGDKRLDGKIGASGIFDAATQTLRLDDVAATLTLAGTQPPQQQPLSLSLKGDAHADLARRSAGGRLTGAFDDSPVAASFDVPGFSPMSLVVDIDIDRLDADRYLSAFSGRSAPGAPKSALPTLSTPPALSGLRGTLHIGRLHIAGATLRNLHFDVGDAVDGNLGAFRMPGQSGPARPTGKTGMRKDRHAAHTPA